MQGSGFSGVGQIAVPKGHSESRWVVGVLDQHQICVCVYLMVILCKKTVSSVYGSKNNYLH